MHGFSIQFQDFIPCFEREKIILLLLYCVMSYMITYTHSRGLLKMQKWMQM